MRRYSVGVFGAAVAFLSGYRSDVLLASAWIFVGIAALETISWATEPRGTQQYEPLALVASGCGAWGC